MLALGGVGLYFLLGRVFPEPMSSVLRGLGGGRRFLAINAMVHVTMGCGMMWLYAAARFRLRSTIRTVLRIAVAVWLLSYMPFAWMLQAFDLLPAVIIIAIAGWGLVTTLLAGLAGGLVHQLTKPDDARY